MMPAIKQKPKKPYRTFPLTAHPNGQWCKKIRGKVHFFGVWAAPKAALDRYNATAVDLHAGRTPRTEMLQGTELTVKDAGNAFLNWQKDKLDTGKIGPQWFEDCRSIITEFAKAVGKHRVVSDLQATDFQKYRTKLARRLGVHALRRHITVIKGLFKYAYDMRLIEDPVRFGRGFEMPTAAQERKARQKAEAENGKKLFTKDELLRLITESEGGYLKAAILLGINGGFGNTDCATVPTSAVDLEEQVISYARPKTGVQRIVPLWPETTDALKRLLACRPTPASDEASRLVFLTPRGNPLVRQRLKTKEDGVVTATNIDDLSSRFAAVLTSLDFKRPGIGFYTLRHTFRTWADETHDQHAVHRVMGHRIPGMSGIYVQEISLDRLRAVVDHVRQRLFSQ